MSMSAKAIESALAMNATIMEQAERIHDLELELFELRAEIARLTLRAPDASPADSAFKRARGILSDEVIAARTERR
jgi:hypothetical protein